MKEMVGGCCVCSDDRGWAENPLVYCDGQGCAVAVHQACYGIVTVPTGPWFCRKCESQERAVRVRCELCPIKDGALKRTDNQAWAHVVCALYIPEVRFGNVTTMEPIILQLVPSERYNKTCYICEEQGKGSRAIAGACMNCNKPGCKMQFHVTCAQGLGLLCEEAGNYMDNVKYCGYCQHHYSKLKKGGNVKQIPPYKSVSNDSTEEREEGGRKRKNQGGKGGGRGRNATPSPNLSKPGGLSPSPGSESGDHSRASTPAGPNGNATKDLLPPPAAASASVIKDSKDKDKKEDRGKDGDKDKDKGKDKDMVGSSVSSTASTTSAKFTTSNFVETVVTPSESVFGTDGVKTTAPNPGPGTAKKRRNAGGARTPPTSTPSQDKDTKEKDKDVTENTTTPTTSSPTTSVSSITNSTVTKMEVDKSPPNSSNQDAGTVEKGVKKLKIVAEPNLSSLGSNSSISESASKGAQGNASSPGPVGSSVTSSANSIVVSVPLTAAVSLPNAPGQQALNAISSGSGTSTQAVGSVSADTHTQQISSSGNSGSNSSNKMGSNSTEVHGKRARSFNGEKPEKVEKQDKRKLKRGGQLHLGSATSPPSAPSPPVCPATTSVPNPPPVATSSPPPTPIPPSTPVSSIPSPLSLSPAPILSPVSSTSSVPSTPVTTPTPTISIPTPLSPVPGRRGRPSSAPAPLPPICFPPQPSPCPFAVAPDIFSSSNISMKESPPSSPEVPPHRGRPKGRRGHHNNSNAANHREEKDVKIFQNGVTSINNAPHMLGNQLNPSSSMAQKMSDTLTAELEAHSVFSSEPNLSNQNNLVGPQLPSRVAGGKSDNRSASNTGVMPQTLDQLLERQWEQGSQFLMEQAQHFDIASLLTCLHQLRSENTRLEEHIRKLQQRRDHLLAVNARLAIPLTHAQPTSTPPTPPHGTPGPSPGNPGHHESSMPAQSIMSIPGGQSPSPNVLPPPPQMASQSLPGQPSTASQGSTNVLLAQGSPQLPPQIPVQNHLGHTPSHQQSHAQQHLQGHSQLPQSLPLTQGHIQGHQQQHTQVLLQNAQGQQSRQRAPYGQQPMENGLPSDSSAMHQGYATHQRPQPSSNIRHTQSGSGYIMSQTPPTSNQSVVRNSSVSSDQRRW